jgi:hypothetical protein
MTSSGGGADARWFVWCSESGEIILPGKDVLVRAAGRSPRPGPKWCGCYLMVAMALVTLADRLALSGAEPAWAAAAD